MVQEYASKQPKGFKNHIENVAIVGAGGQSGKFIVKALLKTGKQKLTAITRIGSTNKIPEGVMIKKVDYDDHASLVESLKGQDALIITMGVRAPEDQQTKLIRAAAEANVKWILPNEFGFDPSNEDAVKDTGLGIAKQKDRELIEQLGMSWVGICCGFWYEFSLSGFDIRYGFDFNKRSVVFYDNGTTKITTSTFPQTGRSVANLLALKILPQDENDQSTSLDNFRNKFAYVGSFVISQKDMFESVLRVTGTKESDWKVSYQPIKERFEEGQKMFATGNMMGFGQLLYARGFFPDGAGNHAETRGLDNEKLGLPREDLDEFTKVAIDMVASDYHGAGIGK